MTSYEKLDLQRVPPEYVEPLGDEGIPDGRWRFYITPHLDGTATVRYMVTAHGRGEQHIVATELYRDWAMIVVDALRAGGPVDQPITHPLGPSNASRP